MLDTYSTTKTQTPHRVQYIYLFDRRQIFLRWQNAERLENLMYRTIARMSAKLNFVPNPILSAVPVDTTGDRTTRFLPGVVFAKIDPLPISDPMIVAVSKPCLKMLGLTDTLDESAMTYLKEILSGNTIAEGSSPHAHRYAGYQFGSFAGQLGDGAAVSLGTVSSESGLLEVALKGSGLTPFSRAGDGRKVLRSSIREFLCSEAMYGLGIPTTRSASVIVSGSDQVWRDVNYSGHAQREPLAVISRISRSFLRFGSFETAKQFLAIPGEQYVVDQLVDYTINTYYPEIKGEGSNRTEQFVLAVTAKTAELCALWQSVGFTHGVLNTDNMSILGETIDYGPFGFMEYFDSSYVPNTSDRLGRYAFNKQSEICKWNCKKLAEAVLPDLSVHTITDRFNEVYKKKSRELMIAKLGIEDVPEADSLIREFYKIMETSQLDWTSTFRILIDLDSSNIELTIGHLMRVKDPMLRRAEEPHMIADPEQQADPEEGMWKEWLAKYQGLRRSDAKHIMKKANPNFILRNYLIQRAIDEAEDGNYEPTQRLLEACLNPYNEDIQKKLLKPQPANQTCNTLSCSS